MSAHEPAASQITLPGTIDSGGAPWRLRPLLIALSWLMLGAGCSYLRSAQEPMPTRTFVRAGPAEAKGAIVLLPGFGDRPETFQERGFVAALSASAPAYDVIAADAHFGYYRKRTLLERLERDVVGPLHAQGYRELWLVGASMGGHGAVAYARTHSSQITGLLLFAPYMGPRDVIDEVRRAGGLCKYRAPIYEDSAEGFARANFDWLREAVCGHAEPTVWLAVGDEDGLRGAEQVLIDALPKSRVLILPGGHGWRVWTPAVRRVAADALAK
jgi:pimeloyl-ACP methyl ester carboxylesterase